MGKRGIRYMILGINSVCHTWHVVEYFVFFIFMKKRKGGKAERKQRSKKGEGKQARKTRRKEGKREGRGRRRRKEGAQVASDNVLCLVLLLSQ